MQSAYRSNHSTETALLRVRNDLLCILDERKAAILVLLDLSAAFDTIDHTIILTRFRDRCGITATCLAWFESYLVNRSQRIQMHGRISAERPVVFGVPQGSVLGPLMCICYTAPLGDIARRHGIDVHMLMIPNCVSRPVRTQTKTQSRQPCASKIVSQNYKMG